MKKQETKQVYVHNFLINLSSALLSIFIPIYMLELGYPVAEALGFLIFLYIILGFSCNVGRTLSDKIGVKKTVLIGMAFQAIFFLMLLSMKDMLWNFFLLGLVYGIGAGIYWQSILSLFSSNSEKKQEGKQTGSLLISQLIGRLFAPIISALLIVFINFEFVTWIAMGLFVTSAIPLYMSKDVKIKSKAKISEIYSLKNLNYAMIYVEQGICSGIYIIAPILMWILSNGYIFVGSFGTVMAAFLITASILARKLSDKMNPINRYMICLGI